MKSAYELAISRLEKESPTAKMSEEQKRALADVSSEFSAKIAERKLFLEGLIEKNAGDPAEANKLRTQLAAEITRLEEQQEAKKEKIRRGEAEKL